ncbi:hypothetical protein [Helicobacter sp. 23-1045]
MIRLDSANRTKNAESAPKNYLDSAKIAESSAFADKIAKIYKYIPSSPTRQVVHSGS